jgi:hypothetical protein
MGDEPRVPLDPNKRIIREHLRVVDGRVKVTLRQSKEVSGNGWKLEAGGGRSDRNSARRTAEQAQRFSEADYAELLLDRDRAHAAGEVGSDAFNRDLRALWAEIRTRGQAFVTAVWEKVRYDLRPATCKAVAGGSKTVGDIVKYWYDTGAMGPTTLYGRVIDAGGKTYRVLWESGNRNRLEQSSPHVTLVLDGEELTDAEKALERVKSGV